MLTSLRIVEHQSFHEDEREERHRQYQQRAARVGPEPGEQQDLQERDVHRIDDGVNRQETKNEAIVARSENQAPGGLEIEQYSRDRREEQRDGIMEAREYQRRKQAVAEQGVQDAHREKPRELARERLPRGRHPGRGGVAGRRSSRSRSAPASSRTPSREVRVGA